MPDSDYPAPYIRRGFFYWAYDFFTFNTLKQVDFNDSYTKIHSKKNHTFITNQSINHVSIKSGLFSKIRIYTNESTYIIRGLTSIDADVLQHKILKTRELSWKQLLSSHRLALETTGNWVGSINKGIFFARNSIYPKKLKKCYDLNALFGNNIPETFKNRAEGKHLLAIRAFLKSELIDRDVANEKYVTAEKRRSMALFDEIETHPLTEEQRNSVVIDEDANLVVAAAGSGKTSVIVGKTAWLLDKQLRKPNEILLLAFGKGARKEMQSRIVERIGVGTSDDISIHTFHSLGLDIIGKGTGKRPSLSKVAEDAVAFEMVLKAIISNNLSDSNFSHVILKWFSEFFGKYESPFNFQNEGEYWEYLRKNDIRSLQGEKLKSFEECQVANFLFLNGIKYHYEPKYEHETATQNRRQYEPDFFLPDYGIYIEHLALKGFARTPPFIDRKNYVQGLRWKRNLHKQHNTKLIETYSCERSQGHLTTNLKMKLSDAGVVFKALKKDEIFDILNNLGQIDPFTKIVATFLGHFKGGQLSEQQLNARAGEGEVGKRNQAFISVFLPIFESYELYLKNEGAIDFHDMIAKATDLINLNQYISPYRYVMVDEFQDISSGRAKLVLALKNADLDTQLFCVGDDWQAIFRFAGSDIGIMKEFGKQFGFFKRLDLSTTFRSPDEITQQATNFILKNPAQIEKSVKAVRSVNEIAVCVGISGAKEGARETILRQTLSKIHTDSDKVEKASVFILGRYNLRTYEKVYRINYLEIIQNLTKEFPALNILFRSVHGSKGLEADYIIVLDVISDFLGFPNEIQDDPIFNMVLASPEEFPNSEERRLFYVALTRAKKKVFILTETGKQSIFVQELIKSPYQVEVFGNRPDKEIKCPVCVAGILSVKNSGERTFFGCSNYPYCVHTEPTCPHCGQGKPLPSGNGIQCGFCEQTVEACPDTNCSGWLQLRNGSYGEFWGCTRYPNCNRTRNV